MGNLSSKVYRGELYWVDWSPGRGSEQTGRRPALVIQENPASSNPNYPSHVAVPPTESNGLSVASYVKCEQLQAVSKERLGQRIGVLEQEVMARVNAALLRVLALPQS